MVETSRSINSIPSKVSTGKESHIKNGTFTIFDSKPTRRWNIPVVPNLLPPAPITLNDGGAVLIYSDVSGGNEDLAIQLESVPVSITTFFCHIICWELPALACTLKFFLKNKYICSYGFRYRYVTDLTPLAILAHNKHKRDIRSMITYNQMLSSEKAMVLKDRR